MGVYAMSRKTLTPYPRGVPFGLTSSCSTCCARRGTGGFDFGGYWLDIGRPDDYDEANRNFERLRPVLLPGAAAPALEVTT